MQEGEITVVEESTPLYEESIEEAENRAAELKPVLEEQCRKLLELIAIDARHPKDDEGPGIRTSCKKALYRAECAAHFDVETIVAVQGPDGEMETAAEQIAQQVSEEAEGGAP